MTEIYLLFYQAVLQTFVNFNKFLQREDPLIPVISNQIESFLTKLASKFLPVSAIKAVTEDFTRLKYNEVIDQLPGRHIIYKLCPKIDSLIIINIDDAVFIGISTRATIRKLLEEGDIGPHDTSMFYKSVRAFYVRAMKYALDNLPIKDPLLRNARFLSFKNKDDATFSQVEY